MSQTYEKKKTMPREERRAEPESSQWAQAITLSALLIFSFKRLPLIFSTALHSEGSATFVGNWNIAYRLVDYLVILLFELFY